MRFPSGLNVDLSAMKLTSSGRTGINGPQVHLPEQPVPLRRMSDRALLQLASELATIGHDEREPSGVQDYAQIVLLQAQRELMDRCL